jgi:hypothetical protein
MNGNHLLLLSHAATGVAADHIGRLVTPRQTPNNRRPEQPFHPADARRSIRQRLKAYINR